MALPKYLYYKHLNGWVMNLWLKAETDTEWVAVSPFRLSMRMFFLKTDPNIVGTGDEPHPESNKNGQPGLRTPATVYVKKGMNLWGKLANAKRIDEDFRGVHLDELSRSLKTAHEAASRRTPFSPRPQSQLQVGGPGQRVMARAAPVPGDAHVIADCGGSLQRAKKGAEFAKPLAVAVMDIAGDPVAGVPVTFSFPQSGASASAAENPVSTDARGYAVVPITANQTAGKYTVVASLPGDQTDTSSVSFPLWND